MYKTRKFQYLISISVVFALAIFGFAMGNVYDKSIAETIFNKTNGSMSGFQGFMCALCPFLQCAFAAFAGVSLFISSSGRYKAVSIIFKIIAILGIGLTTYIAYNTSTEAIKAFNTDNEKIKAGLKFGCFTIVLIIDAVVGFFTYKFAKKYPNKNKLFWTSFTIIFIIGGCALFSEFIKYLASRPRPFLVFKGTYEYKEWYQWNPLYGFKDSNCKSFVSGHSTNGSTALTIVPLILSLTKLNDKKYMIPLSVGICGVYWAVLVSTRILCSAHFLTDISAAAIFSIFWQVVIVLVIDAIQKKTGDIISPVSK